jgi:hypothetical protein
MKNKMFKTCLTSLALSVAGLANAGEPVKIFTPQLISHAAISGGALSIAADALVDGHLASQAAVTTGARSVVQNIVSGAATGMGAAAKSCDIYAGAAIAVGAGSTVGALTAGGAVTLGALANRDVMCVSAPAVVTSDFDAANAQIKSAQSALDTIPASSLVDAYTLVGSMDTGVYEGAAITIPASTVIAFDANHQDGVWIFNLSGAMTVGASSQFEIINAGDNNAVIWNIGGALTLGAGSTFLGTAFVEGAVSGATASVSCGNLYATGAISIGSIGSIGGDDCKVSADMLADFAIADNEFSFLPQYAIGDTGPAGGIVFYIDEVNGGGIEAALNGSGLPARFGCYATIITGIGGGTANGTAIGTGAQNTLDIVSRECITQGGNTGFPVAADVAAAYTFGGFADWYLPSKDEARAMGDAGVFDYGGPFYGIWTSSQDIDADHWNPNGAVRAWHYRPNTTRWGVWEIDSSAYKAMVSGVWPVRNF